MSRMTALKRKAKQPEDVPMMEREVVDSLLDAAKELGWLAHHDRPALTERGWRTAIQGDKGFPDLLLTKDGRSAVWEVKSDVGKVSPAQQQWLDELAKVPGVDVRVVRPADLEAAYRFLAGVEETPQA